MQITGKKKWVILILTAMLGGIMVYLPFLRYSYYDQMVILFTQYRHVAEPERVNSFIGTFALWEGIAITWPFLVGGVVVDRFGEKWPLIIGCIVMGLCAIWLGTVPNAGCIILIHVLYGFATTFAVWSAYITITRKMGKKSEQGRMFSISEFVRNAIIGTALGFLGVALLNTAVMPSGETDPQILGAAWKTMHFIDGGLMILISIVVAFILPKDIKAAEDTEAEAEGKLVPKQEKASLANVIKVAKLPGVWLLTLLIFFCYSFTAAANGYMGAYTSNVLGVSSTTASTFAIIRNYIISGLSVLAIGFIADKIGSKIKTLEIYLSLATILTAVVLLTKNAGMLAMVVTLVFAAVYSGMRSLYFASLSDVGIPVALTSVATAIISTLCYLPDVYFAKLAGGWLDTMGNKGYDMIWYWCIGCGILGVITAKITQKYIDKLNAKEKLAE